MRLTADMFVVNDGEILLLCRRGRGEGLWYIPGGIVELGEDPRDAAVRETAEESGIDVVDPRLLRVWSYEVEDGRWVYHATYVATAPHRQVTISDEHSGSKWCPPQEYLEADLAAWASIDDPVVRSFTPQVATNLQLLLDAL